MELWECEWRNEIRVKRSANVGEKKGYAAIERCEVKAATESPSHCSEPEDLDKETTRQAGYFEQVRGEIKFS